MRWRIVMAALLAAMGVPGQGNAEVLDGRVFHPVEVDIRTLPAVGFFPLGGTLSIQSTQCEL